VDDVTMHVRGFLRTLPLLGLLLNVGASAASSDESPGRSIGKVSVAGKLIVIELDDGALGKASLFDLEGQTLRFTPRGSRYEVEKVPLRWDADFGPELTGSEATLQQLAFPFSGRPWRSFLVGTTGCLRFGASEKEVPNDPYGHREAGIVLGRFDQLAEAANKLTEPAICPFLKPRLSGPHFVKELADRVVITWDLTEPFGSLLDFTWFRSVNQFQAVLHRNGGIEMSYKEMAARDAIVGIYPTLTSNERAEVVNFSALATRHGAFTAPYEVFHYLSPPRPQDLSCTVIKALGDRFDFLAYYSDFRVDSQEASPPSDGPIGGHVSGIGDTQHEQSSEILRSRCTKGRFQLGYAQPVFVSSNEAQPGPPPGAPAKSNHDIAFYSREMVKAAQNGKGHRYSYAVGHLGHEVGHRWGAYATAKMGGETMRLGPWPHWAPGLQTRVAFPYSLPVEASTLGGSVWQDNLDGTYTQLRDGFFVPASGYSHLDLYLMGLMTADEVPDFFILNKLDRVGEDAAGRPIFKADRLKVTVQDVIAAEGPRLPDALHSQRKFNTGIVVITEHGHKPSRALLKRADDIRSLWIDYWATATGHRAAMTTNPR
jgi:hypothetical protein